MSVAAQARWPPDQRGRSHGVVTRLGLAGASPCHLAYVPVAGRKAVGALWHALYYRDNYARLRRIKATWDPTNVFRHALSIEPA